VSLFDVSDYDAPASPQVEAEVEAEVEPNAELAVVEITEVAPPEPMSAEEPLGAEIVGAEVLDAEVIADVGGAGPAEVLVPSAPEPDEEILREPSVDALWTEIIGQDEAVRQLRAPVHAYLFAGPAGVGKLVAARSFAAALLCPRGGCGRCSVCVRALAEAHPDLVVVEREGASITVDQAREIVRLAMRSPTEGPRKVLVLVDFHLVTAAAPTLLKIIEEPPPSTVFVVVAEQITPELVTIASRCVVVPFAVLGRRTIIDRLVHDGAPLAQAERAADLAGGRLDRARLLVADPDLGSRLEFWERIPARLDGTGAAVSVIVAETIALLDHAAVGPLAARQEAEATALEARLEAVGARGGSGARKELAERHKREQKRVRDDELRFGLGILSRTYAMLAMTPSDVQARSLGAVDRIAQTNVHLERNPNLALALQSLLLHLS
jgi:DNA polymerase III subunit delta'